MGNPRQEEGYEIPYYVVNVGRGRSTHIMKSGGTWVPGLASQIITGAVKVTLCGLTATRYVNVFTPSEASCRECKKRWQLAVAPESAKMQAAQAPGKSTSIVVGCLLLLVVILLVVGGIITGIVLLVAKGHRDAGYPAKGMLARIPGCTVTAASDHDLPSNETSAAKCTLDDNALVEIWTWSNNPPDTTDQQEWAYSESHPFVQLGPTPDCCIVGTSPAPWVAEISGDETYVASVRASDWSTVQVALDGQVVTNPPASWSQYPVPAGSP